MEYVVISTCKNEQSNIAHMIHSIYQQTIKPLVFILIDDSSTDETYRICNHLALEYKTFYPFHTEFKRLEYAGFNMTVALNYAYEYLKYADPFEYILKIDGDVVLEDHRYVETILKKMNKDSKIYIGGGCSDKLISSPDHVQDGAKIYRIKCLELIKEHHGSAFPMIYGFDTYMQLFIQYLGYNIISLPDLLWIDKRPFQLTIKRAIMSGKFHYINNYPFLHELKVMFMTVRHNKHHKKQSIVRFITYLLYHLKMKSPLLKEHREYVNKRFMLFFMNWLRYRIYLLKKR